MIDHATELLAKAGRRFEGEVLMFGFSASGNFVNRFTFLHPERVHAAAAAGGLNGMPILPLETLEGMDLYYPVGVYDVEGLTGRKLDREAIRKTPQYLFMGELDSNDTLPYDDAFDVRERRIIEDVFDTVPVKENGKDQAVILLDRFEKCRQIYRRAEMPADFVVYEGIGHTLNEDVIRDIVDFFKNTL
jgi:predicted esterase